MSDVICTWPSCKHTAKGQCKPLVPETADELTRLRAEVERLREAERTAWEPPPAWERPFNFECLGWVYGGWDFVFWNDTHWVTRKGNPCTPGHFRPLPPTPEARHD